MYFILAWRNIWRNKRRTMITISSIMFAVIFALFIESIERGAHELAIDNVTRFHVGYIQVQDYRFENEPFLDNAFAYDENRFERIALREDSIEFIVPRIETFMLAAGEEITRGAVVLGIDPDKEQKLNGLKDRIRNGRFFQTGDGTVVISEGLAGRLGISTGDELVLLGQGRFGMTAAGKFEVSGIVELPVREMNNQMVYMSLSDAQWLLSSEEHITALLVTPVSERHTEYVAQLLRSELRGREYNILTWHDMIPELIRALDFDRAQTRIYMAILYVVIGFGIFGTILTMTLERIREFGMLLSVGMQRFRLAFVVFTETFILSILGIAAGYLTGFFVLLYFRVNPIAFRGDTAEWMLELGFDPVLPAAIASDIFLWQGLLVFCLTTVICLYPVLRIYRLDILDASRS